MADDNETIKDIVRELLSEPLAENGAKPWLHYLADRIIAAHKREIAAKYAEIESLKDENARLRVIVSGAAVAEGNLREEIVRLRALVKELADALTTCMLDELDGCATRREREEVSKHRKEYRALVARAEEVVK